MTAASTTGIGGTDVLMTKGKAECESCGGDIQLGDDVYSVGAIHEDRLGFIHADARCEEIWDREQGWRNRDRNGMDG